MKVRWREHELIMATVLSAISIGLHLRNMIAMTAEEIRTVYGTPFIAQGRSFNPIINMLFPQVAQVLLLYLAYLAVAFIIIPALKRLSWNELSVSFIKGLGWVVLQVGVTGYLLALGANVLTAFGRPHYFNYGFGGFEILSLFGYNDQPLKSLFTGFNRAFDLVAIATVIGGLREVIINYMESDRPGRSYRILVLNQVTAIIALYVSIVPLILFIAAQSFPGLQKLYFNYVPPTLIVAMVNIHWLFPLTEETPVINPRMFLRLLGCTFLCTVPFVAGHERAGVYLASLWMVELFVVTPLSWLIYRQRREKILHLRGVERDLARSNAELQLLRSQINPHFLFNVLNTLYGTAMLENAARTAEGIQRLGDMMRAMLHQNNLDFISLRSEVEYLRNFIALQKLRTQASADIVIEEDIDASYCDRDIAPMLLIPLVENAFKHGVSLTAKSWIGITLVCRENVTRLVVRNSVHKPQHDRYDETSGIGLENIQKRLKLIYAGKHRFYSGIEGNEFIAELSIRHQ